MKNFWKRATLALGLIVLTLSFVHALEEYSLDKALKVVRIISQAERNFIQGENRTGQTVIISEDELNAYIAYRVEVDREEVMKELSLKLLDDNWVEGRVVVDLEGKEFFRFLKPHMTFYFSGRIESEDGRGRLRLKELFLEGQRIQTQILDAVIYIASKLDSQDPWLLEGWYGLPFGVRSVEIREGHAVFHF